jgi:hypothetical protein
MKYVTFQHRDLNKLIKHSKENVRHYPYTNKIAHEIGLTLVKDEGVYLMSSAKKTLLDPKRKLPEGLTPNLVVYGKGYKPTESNKDTLWDKTYEFSRDDFAEFIPLTPQQLSNLKSMHIPKITIGLDQETDEMVISV